MNINFEELETLAARPENKLLLFCHPLNPVSRVLSEEELRLVQKSHRRQRRQPELTSLASAVSI